MSYLLFTPFLLSCSNPDPVSSPAAGPAPAEPSSARGATPAPVVAPAEGVSSPAGAPVAAAQPDGDVGPQWQAGGVDHLGRTEVVRGDTTARIAATLVDASEVSHRVELSRAGKVLWTVEVDVQALDALSPSGRWYAGRHGVKRVGEDASPRGMSIFDVTSGENWFPTPGAAGDLPSTMVWGPNDLLAWTTGEQGGNRLVLADPAARKLEEVATQTFCNCGSSCFGSTPRWKGAELLVPTWPDFKEGYGWEQWQAGDARWELRRYDADLKYLGKAGTVSHDEACGG